MSTALDIISSSLRLLGVLAEGETPSAAQGQDGLVVLNDMLDAWEIERLMIFTISIADYALIANQQAYTLGTGGNFNAARPAKIDRMSLVLLSNPTNPLELSMEYTESEELWQQILLKKTNSTYPLFCYDDGGFPNRTLNFWPIPRDVNNVRIYSWSALSSFADITPTDYTFPPSYREALRYNLAVRLADEYDRPVKPTTAAMAQQALARIKTFNAASQIRLLKCDDAYITPSTQRGNETPARARQEWFGIP